MISSLTGSPQRQESVKDRMILTHRSLYIYIYINSLVTKIKSMNLGVKYGKTHLSIVVYMYADDIVLISETEDSLQSMLNKLNPVEHVR